MTDYQVKKMSQIGQNLIACKKTNLNLLIRGMNNKGFASQTFMNLLLFVLALEIDLVIHKKPIASQHSFLLWEKGILNNE